MIGRGLYIHIQVKVFMNNPEAQFSSGSAAPTSVLKPYVKHHHQTRLLSLALSSLVVPPAHPLQYHDQSLQARTGNGYHHPEDLAGGVAALQAACAGLAHFLQLEGLTGRAIHPSMNLCSAEWSRTTQT